MATGTVEPFLKLPEDINPPKPSYFHDVFHLVHAYLQVLSHIPDIPPPSKGLVKLYSYRMGVLDIDNSLLEKTYLDNLDTNRFQRTRLQEFGRSAIAFNIQTLYKLLTNTLVSSLKIGFGDDNCLTSEVVHALNQFAKLQNRTENNRTKRYDSMDALTETCHYNATYDRRDGVSSSQAIIRIIDVLDLIMQSPTDASYFDMTGYRRTVNALRIVFYIGCRYYHINLLRLSDEIIKRSYDRNLNITDFTLAAVPFDPLLIQSCSDDTSGVSRWGIEYLQSLDAVLLYFGGLRYAATFTVEANGNKGIENV